MEQKINRAILCLYAVGLAQIYGLYKAVSIALELQRNADLIAGSGISPYNVFGAGTVIEVATLIAIFKIIPELRKQTTTGFIGALLIFFFTVNTWALPACIFGLFCLFDAEVRTPFLQKLDIKI